MRWSPFVTVAAVVHRQGQFLMVEEHPDGRPVLNQPAGHVEFGESLSEAICREVLEETGRPFRPSALTGIYQWTVPGTDHTYLRFCFVGMVGERIANRALDPDICATHWLSRDEVADGEPPPRSPLVLRCIDDTLAGRALPLDVLRTLG
ncbi:MAG: NUDIX hydrolase [Gammaproteobacteria bacterium]|nr:NUDIX hydrolase [Gammaproteobacteria bacterium]